MGASWRWPQYGAIGALLAHWSLEPDTPALVSLPTGTGKTGVALATPFLTPVPPRRVLVLVPSAALREHMEDQFRSLDLLQDIGALSAGGARRRREVIRVEGYAVDWRELEDADVVVAIPQSISPAAAAVTSVVPPGFFDLVIVDEAHHAPAATWRALLDHLDFSNAVLLTATPFRLDRQVLPGNRVFYYPLRHAINERFYKPITPEILPPPSPFSEVEKDRAIRNRVVELLATPPHQSSSLLVRARTIDRAGSLAELYRQSGVEMAVLHSRVSGENQEEIRRNLQSGSTRAVSVVGMLGEGFDLPSLRLVAYHDKHKSTPATVQLIGRLARVDDRFPQESVLVTVDDTDVYPELVGLVSKLYQEDADWATLLPGLVDTQVQVDEANRAFAQGIQSSRSDLDPIELRPMPTPVIYEVAPGWMLPSGTDGLPVAIDVGETIASARVLFAEATGDGSMLVIVTRRSQPPPWYSGAAIESITHGLHVISFRPAPQTDLPALLFVDSSDTAVVRALFDVLAVPDGTAQVSPERLDGYLESLPRTSVSMIGMRNVLAGTRGTSYKTRAGSSTDTDLRSVETSQTALGHIMMVINTTDGSTTVGGAFEKGKLWQRRYKQLADYSDWITEAAELLWYPRRETNSRLVPQVSRGRTLFEFPDAIPIAAEMHPAVRIGGFTVMDGDEPIGSIEDIEIHVGADPTGSYALPSGDQSQVPGVAVVVDRDENAESVCWVGVFGANGSVQTLGRELDVHRGVREFATMSEFLEHYPPTLFFLNGQATQGTQIFDIRGTSIPEIDLRLIAVHPWVERGANIRAESDRTAQDHEESGTGTGHSVHAELERYLMELPRRRRHRWVLNNDGSGEIADYIVLEYESGSPLILSLWHAKPAGGEPGLRVDDFQVVIGQAMRSRSWFNDPSLWQRLLMRLTERERPVARLVEGSDARGRLLVLLGEQIGSKGSSSRSWPRITPVMQGEISIAQPGLSRQALVDALPGTAGETVTSLRQLISVLSDTVAVTGDFSAVLGSP